MLDTFTLGDAADVNPLIKFLPHTLHVCARNLITGLTSAASPRVDISSTCKVGQKLRLSHPLLTCPLRHDHPDYCTAEVGNSGGTYELVCISRNLSTRNINEIVKIEKMSGVLSEIQTGNLPNTNQKLAWAYVFGTSHITEWAATVEGSMFWK